MTGGKVLVHSPHEGGGTGISDDQSALPNVRYLNFNKNITALAAGMIYLFIYF